MENNCETVDIKLEKFENDTSFTDWTQNSDGDVEADGQYAGLYEKKTFMDKRENNKSNSVIKLEDVDIKEELVDEKLIHSREALWNSEEDNRMDHAGKKMKRRHKCHLCEYAAKQKGTLNRHINAIHLHLKKYKCNVCDYVTAQQGNLKIHIDSRHLNIPKYKCKSCDYVTACKRDLKTHIDTVHLSIKIYQCNVCEYTCLTKRHLKFHIESVHLMIKYDCHTCDYSSFRKDNLKSHIKSVHLNVIKTSV